MPLLNPGCSYLYRPSGPIPKPFGSAKTFSKSCPFSCRINGVKSSGNPDKLSKLNRKRSPEMNPRFDHKCLLGEMRTGTIRCSRISWCMLLKTVLVWHSILDQLYSRTWKKTGQAQLSTREYRSTREVMHLSTAKDCQSWKIYREPHINIMNTADTSCKFTSGEAQYLRLYFLVTCWYLFQKIVQKQGLDVDKGFWKAYYAVYWWCSFDGDSWWNSQKTPLAFLLSKPRTEAVYCIEPQVFRSFADRKMLIKIEFGGDLLALDSHQQIEQILLQLLLLPCQCRSIAVLTRASPEVPTSWTVE